MDDQLAELLNAPPDPNRPYMYRGTRTHINKFGVLNPDALERVVRAITSLRVELLKQKPVPGNFELKHLCAIHLYLFQDIYDWAGQTRIVEFSRDSKTNSLQVMRNMNDDITKALPVGPPFKSVSEIEPELKRVLSGLERDDLTGLEKDEFAERLAYYLLALYTVHPFRDGNGRTIRCFLGQLAASHGWSFNLDGVPQLERHMTAFNAQCGDSGPFRALIRQSLQPL